MNRGFKEYLKLGKKETKKIFKQKGNFFRYYLYQLMNLMKLTILWLIEIMEQFIILVIN